MSGPDGGRERDTDAYEPFDPSSTDYTGETPPTPMPYDQPSGPTAYHLAPAPGYQPPPGQSPPPLYYPPQYYYHPYPPYWRPPNPSLPMVGGVICIVAGALSVMISIFPFGWLFGIELVCSAFVLLSAIVAIVGGFFAIRRTNYTLAIMGAIACVLCSVSLMGVGLFLGILALILIAMGKDAFDSAVVEPLWGWPRR